MGFQEIDIVSLVRPITKYAVTVTEPQAIRYHLEKAIYWPGMGGPARYGSIFRSMCSQPKLTRPLSPPLQPGKSHPVETPKPPDLLPRQVGEMIRLLNQAERPVILVGNGVRLGQAINRFRRLIDLLNLPVLTTWKAIDFLPESHPLYAGRPGAVGQRGANFAQQNSDWFLGLGARLDLGQTGFNHANFARARGRL